MIKLSLLTIALFASMSANAAFIVQIPLENKLGGSLSDNSLSWVGGTDSGTVGGGAGNGNGNGSDDGAGSNDGKTEEEKALARKCDADVNSTVKFLKSNYPDVSYEWHDYSDAYESLPPRCQIVLAIPKSKSNECTGDVEYIRELAAKVTPFGIETVATIPVGEC